MTQQQEIVECLCDVCECLMTRHRGGGGSSSSSSRQLRPLRSADELSATHITSGHIQYLFITERGPRIKKIVWAKLLN